MPAVGIDFGTTKTLVACWDPERKCPRTVRLGRGRDDLPTTLHFDTHGQLSFGDNADDLRETEPEGYLRCLKRALGRRKRVILRQQSNDAVDLTAEYLKYVKRRAEEEKFQGSRITSAVLTVPALFGEAARAGLVEAAGKAELKEVQLLEEPLAAGMAFLEEKKGTPLGERVLVFDWGGGTLDLALLHQRNGRLVINPELVGGDDTCGGEDIDDLFGTQIAACLPSLGIGNEELQSPRLQFAIARQAREAKHHLSQKEVADIRLVADGRVLHLPWKREEFDALIAPTVERAVATLQQLVARCEASGQRPGYVLLVGGSSRIPLVASMIRVRTGLTPVSWDYSIEAVAIGAALRANEGTRTTYGEEKARREADEVVARLKKILDGPGATDTTKRRDVTSEMIGICKTLADTGNAEAQCLVGRCCLSGYGVAQDHAEALKWFRKAAEQGDAVAQNGLGVCYHTGSAGVPRNGLAAAEWYRKAAEQGHAKAQYNLGLCYRDGFGVAKDGVEEVRWLWKAAEQGDAPAQSRLGTCYLGGTGVGVDAQQAVAWYRKAAAQGDSNGQCGLGLCYLDGFGVGKDHEQAVEWFRRASAQGHATASERLQQLKKAAGAGGETKRTPPHVPTPAPRQPPPPQATNKMHPAVGVFLIVVLAVIGIAGAMAIFPLPVCVLLISMVVKNTDWS
jgi:TPR repeat protein/actin-like ATPase involved in cell morphogenesis